MAKRKVRGLCAVAPPSTCSVNCGAHPSLSLLLHLVPLPSVTVHPASVTIHPASVTVHPASVTVHPASVTVHVHPASVTVHPASVTVHPASSHGEHLRQHTVLAAVDSQSWPGLQLLLTPSVMARPTATVDSGQFWPGLRSTPPPPWEGAVCPRIWTLQSVTPKSGHVANCTVCHPKIWTHCTLCNLSPQNMDMLQTVQSVIPKSGHITNCAVCPPKIWTSLQTVQSVTPNVDRFANSAVCHPNMWTCVVGYCPVHCRTRPVQHKLGIVESRSLVCLPLNRFQCKIQTV